MAAIKYTQQILEAIDQLRRRKARPDRKRICNFVCRRYMVNSRDVIADLERLVDEQVVIRVEYKGNISYRNAAKWAKLSVHKSRVEIENRDLKTDKLKEETDRKSHALRGALSELIVKHREFIERGVPVYALEAHLLSKDSEFFARLSFKALLNRETSAGTIVKLANGNYSFPPIAATMKLPRALSPAEMIPSPKPGGQSIILNGSDSATKGPLIPKWTKLGEANKTEATITTSVTSTSPSNSSLDEKQAMNPDEHDAPDDEPDDYHNDVAPTSPNHESVSEAVCQDEDLDKHLEQEPGLASEVPDNDHGLSGKKQKSGADTATAAAEAAENTESSGYRAGERRKRAKKKVFDPSDNNMPRSKRRGRASVGTAKNATHDENGNREKLDAPAPIVGPVCTICTIEIKDSKSTSCRDCTKRAHTSCLLKGQKAGSKVRSTPWQCTNCKSCQLCSQTKELGAMAVCSSCDDGYHVKCLVPRPRLPLKKWLCQRCSPPPPPPPPPQPPPEPKSATSTPDASPPRSRNPPMLMPIVPLTGMSPVGDMFADFNDSSIDESIPDASEWTSVQVFEFFENLFPEHAHVFKDQDIDGRSLLLMTRNDVTRGLNLKLGPALKIYKQVKRLQLRRSDPNLAFE